MAETEVSKEASEMVAIEEKCVLDMSSYQDLPKPDFNGTDHHNQANDLDNSYVFVSGTDGVTEDVGNEEVGVEHSTVLPESDATGVKDQGAEFQSQLDTVSGEIQPLNEAEGSRVLPESDASGVKDQGAELQSQIDAVTGEFQPLNEAEGIEDVEFEGSRVLPESDASGVKDEGAELQPQIDALSGEFQPLNEAEGIEDVEVEGSRVLPESDASGVKDQGAELQSQVDTVSGEFQPLNDAEGIEDVEVEGSRVLPESDASGVKDQGAELQSQVNAVSGEFQTLNDAEVIEDVEVEGSRVLPESDASGVKDQGAELQSQIDAVSGEFQPLNEAEGIEDMEVEGSRILSESDAYGVNDQVAELQSQIDAVSGEFQPLNEAEGMEVEGSRDLPESDASGVKDQGAELQSQIDAVTGEFQPLNEAEGIEDVEVEGSRVLPESDASGVKDEGAELQPQIDALSGEFQPLNEAEGIEDVEVEGSRVLPESDASGVKDQGAELQSQVDTVSGEFQSLNDAEGIEDVEVEGSRVLPESDAFGVKDQGAELQSQVNAVSGEFQTLNDAEVIEDVEVEGSRVLPESDASGVKDQGAELQSQIDAVSGEFQPLNEAEGIEDVEVEGSRVLPESDASGVKDQGAELQSKMDAVSVEFQPLNEAEGIIEPNSGGRPLVDVDVEAECLSVLLESDAAGVKDQPTELHPQIEINGAASGEFQPLNEAEGSIVLLESDAAVKDQGVELHSQIEKIDAVSENFQPLNEVWSIGDPPLVNGVDEGVVEAEGLSLLPEYEADSHVQTVSNLVAEEQNENFCASEEDNGVQYPEETNEQPCSSVVSHDTILSEIKTEASMQTQSHPVSNARASQSENSDAETVGAAPIISPKSQVFENSSPSYDSGIRCPDVVVFTEKETACQGDEAQAETKVSSGKVEAAVPPPTVKLEPEGHADTSSAISRGGMTNDVAVSCRTEVSDSVNVDKEATNVMLDVKGSEDIGDQLDGATDSGNDNFSVQENEDTGNSQCCKISVASAGGTSVNTSDGKEQSVTIKTKPFNFLIRIPRFDDENLREQIRVAKIHVDEKTKLRDAVQIQIQEKRANNQIHGIDYEYAKSEARSARKLVRSKRMEIDSLQSVINKAKNALSIEDIDSQIYNMEYMIQHETLPLKEEKQLIREIKQLKQLRDQLSSNMGSKDEIKQAIEQRGEVEERLKILRKELDVLKNRVLKAEATAAEVEKKYDEENKKVKELQVQFRAADDVRQSAYAQWQNLRKELSQKSEHFFKYKDDAAVASNYAYSRDTEALYLLCMNQVDNFMELWNTSDEFRRDYVKFNTRSSVRRFGTLDGRALGPDEVAPRLPSYADDRARRMMASTSVKAVDLESPIPSPNENTNFDNKVTKKAMESKCQKVTKEPAIISVQANGLDVTHDVEVAIRSKEEIESIRREEEKTREEMEAKLKEQRRVEALEKANEARERKKRQAEKLQMRADLKTQKEAEQREKEREKRLRKKERKKSDVNDMKSVNCESGPSSESAAESSKDTEVVVNETVCKKQQQQQQQAQKPWLLGKQSKAKSIPPPLRNRNKKKLQQWMWVGVTSVMILLMFWLGNIGVFSNVALRRRAPIH